jgi:hypothetical protein
MAKRQSHLGEPLALKLFFPFNKVATYYSTQAPPMPIARSAFAKAALVRLQFETIHPFS